jgi:hypothetical protein
MLWQVLSAFYGELGIWLASGARTTYSRITAGVVDTVDEYAVDFYPIIQLSDDPAE